MKTFVRNFWKIALYWAAFGACAVLTAAWMAYALSYSWNDPSALRWVVWGNVLSSSKWNLLIGNVDNLNERLSNAESLGGIVPVGAVMAFDLNSCPTGWTEYVPAYGRTIRGIDKSGTSIDPDWVRTKGSLQGDLIRQHRHPQATNNGVADPNPRETGNPYYGQGIDYGDGYWTVWTDYSWWAETRMKNVALLYCVKN